MAESQITARWIAFFVITDVNPDGNAVINLKLIMASSNYSSIKCSTPSILKEACEDFEFCRLEAVAKASRSPSSSSTLSKVQRTWNESFNDGDASSSEDDLPSFDCLNGWACLDSNQWSILGETTTTIPSTQTSIESRRRFVLLNHPKQWARQWGTNGDNNCWWPENKSTMHNVLSFAHSLILATLEPFSRPTNQPKCP